MGDPVGAARHVREALAAGRHVADRRAVRRRPRRGQPQPGRPRLLRGLDAALHARVARRRRSGSRSARRPARRGCARSSPPAASRASAAPPRRRSTWCSRRGRDRSSARPAGAREQTRARVPGRRRATSSATACASSTRSTATATPTDPAAADVVDHPLAPLEGADPLPRAALPGRHVRRARQRHAPTARAASRPTPSAEFAADALAVLDATDDRRRRCSSGSRAGALWAHAARRRPPRARAGRDRSSRPRCRSRPAHPERAIVAPLRGASSTPTRAGRSTTATTGSATTTASSSSSSARCSASRTRPSRSRTASAGRSRPTPRRSPTRPRRSTLCGPERRSRDAVRARRAARCSSSTATRTRSARTRQGAALAEVTGGAARHARGRRPRPAGARPGAGQPAAARVRRRPPPPRRALDAAAAAGRKRALYVSSPIGLGHARRDVAIARELRALHPDLEIDWLAQHPVTRVLEAEGERVHPASALPGQRVRARRVRVGRARPALLPGLPPDGRDPRRQLHGLPRRRARRALRPLDRRRGLGRRLLPAREPGAQARSRTRG